VVALVFPCLVASCERDGLPDRQAKEFRQGSGYLLNTVDAMEVAREQIYEVEAQRAVQMFQVEHGRLPRDLQELKAKASPPLRQLKPPRRYVYDPETGTVTVK
jgi:hypothetical protein